MGEKIKEQFDRLLRGGKVTTSKLLPTGAGSTNLASQEQSSSTLTGLQYGKNTTAPPALDGKLTAITFPTC
jgi:hypothetical protein